MQNAVLQEQPGRLTDGTIAPDREGTCQPCGMAWRVRQTLQAAEQRAHEEFEAHQAAHRIPGQTEHIAGVILSGPLTEPEGFSRFHLHAMEHFRHSCVFEFPGHEVMCSHGDTTGEQQDIGLQSFPDGIRQQLRLIADRVQQMRYSSCRECLSGEHGLTGVANMPGRWILRVMDNFIAGGKHGNLWPAMQGNLGNPEFSQGGDPAGVQRDAPVQQHCSGGDIGTFREDIQAGLQLLWLHADKSRLSFIKPRLFNGDNCGSAFRDHSAGHDANRLPGIQRDCGDLTGKQRGHDIQCHESICSRWHAERIGGYGESVHQRFGEWRGIFRSDNRLCQNAIMADIQTADFSGKKFWSAGQGVERCLDTEHCGEFPQKEMQEVGKQKPIRLPIVTRQKYSAGMSTGVQKVSVKAVVTGSPGNGRAAVEKTEQDT